MFTWKRGASLHSFIQGSHVQDRNALGKCFRQRDRQGKGHLQKAHGQNPGARTQAVLFGLAMQG